ncbi:DUF2336 domain-containing protein [Shinella sp. AETb1-6]|uniref:DUF2336 domain-containing protein n=1 Tax=Shinella TaxID=323620 RepID=UPI00106E2917|nr:MULTISPECIES: DUF2336 domain-containing protein [Shinella]MCD1266466.1 DUF2336 domain-containing protein [Shinella sumterensis]MXN53543.1 DUF2336 domain-containing protein [Shinella sp. AETb1-6]TFE94818.1 hypothetical protein B5M44_22900 [Shinella sumterensis]
MIVHAFLRWIETARAADRAKAASVLARAYAKARIAPDDRRAAEMAMIFLLDDPAPKVRLALAEALASCADAPRAVILPLAEDQPEIAAHIILCSCLLTDADLVDLAAKGSDVTRMLIANRSHVSRVVSAALAEVGDVEDVLALLENEGAMLSRRSLARIAERLGHDADIRALLLDREDLPSDARHALVEKVGTALAGFGLIQAAVGTGRVERITREACDVATIGMVADVAPTEMPTLVEHLRVTGRLTPVFLMHALCTGRAEFFVAAIANLSGQEERRVRSILSDGREAAVRALYETTGLGVDISALFAEATMLWRREAKGGDGLHSVSEMLLARSRAMGNAACQAMLELVERLAIAEQRQTARSYALIATREAA